VAAPITDPVRKFLEKPNFAVLATSSGAKGLQATPVWFLYEGGQIIINTSQGRVKLRNMEKHADVALAIMDRENPYQYVQIRGTVAGFDTRNAARDIDRLSQRYVGKPYGYPGGDSPAKRVTIRIAPTRVSAQGF
jgi:PPOX class probable F420-dependent enzyme